MLADVHGNPAALEVVLAEVEREAPDWIVFLGDLTWGSLPRETLELVRPLAERSTFIRGNAERALLECWDRFEDGENGAAGDGFTERDRWMAEHHTREDRDFLATFCETATVSVAGLGAVLCCHGSPRSDEELVTEETPDERMRELLAGVEAEVLATAHTHVSYDRTVLGTRAFNPGSVGMPYEGRSGAYWALLGPDIELRRTPYDVERAVSVMRVTSDPRVEQVAELLLQPPTRREAIENAESLRFSG